MKSLFEALISKRNASDFSQGIGRVETGLKKSQLSSGDLVRLRDSSIGIVVLRSSDVDDKIKIKVPIGGSILFHDVFDKDDFSFLELKEYDNDLTCKVDNKHNEITGVLRGFIHKDLLRDTSKLWNYMVNEKEWTKYFPEQ